MPKRYLSILPLVLGTILGTSAFSVVYMCREGGRARELAASRDQLRSSLAEARGEIQALSAKVAALNSPKQETPGASELILPPAGRPPVRHRRVVKSAPAVRRPVEDPRWKQIRSQLAQQHERITKTQQDLQRTEEELGGRLNSARDELNGSIAKTHDDVLALQKRGERNYYEFQIVRSKQFQQVGPIRLSLKKANTKHRYYDLAMIVDDAGLDKKHVNLYEPVWINLSDQRKPVELVVNRIDKDQIRGYVSEPKYKIAELASAPAPTASQPTLKRR
jgi:hypothetical protein